MSSPSISLANALAIDRALSEGQLQRRFGAGVSLAGTLTGVVICDKILPLNKGLQPVRFVVSADYAHFTSGSLRHLAGLAEMRYQLKATNWLLPDHFDPEKPDALWGDIAIEYDAGEYSRHRLRYKLGAMEAFPAQIWGVATPARAKTIRHLASLMGIANLQDVIVAPWF